MIPFQDAQYSSSQSSSNTLSSNASSSAHSDEKWYEVGSRSGVRSDLELGGYLQGASTDSGIDITSFNAAQNSTASSMAACVPKDKVPWQEEATEDQGPVDTPPSTADSLVVRGGEIPPKSPSASALSPDGGLADTASRSRYAAAPSDSRVCAPASVFNQAGRGSKLCGLATKGKRSNEITAITVYLWEHFPISAYLLVPLIKEESWRLLEMQSVRSALLDFFF